MANLSDDAKVIVASILTLAEMVNAHTTVVIDKNTNVRTDPDVVNDIFKTKLEELHNKYL
jgi:hypothetical protein